MADLTVVLSLGLLLASGLPGDTGVQADIPGDNENPKKSDTDCLESAKTKVNQCVSSFKTTGKSKEEACRLGSAAVTCISNVETSCTAYTFKKHTDVPFQLVQRTVKAYCDDDEPGCVEKAHFDMLSCVSHIPRSLKMSTEEHCRHTLAAGTCISGVLNSCKESSFKAVFGVDSKTVLMNLAAKCKTTSNTGCATKTKSDITACYSKVTKDASVSAEEQCRSKLVAVDCIDAALNSCKETNFKALFGMDLQMANSVFLAGCNKASNADCATKTKSDVTACYSKVTKDASVTAKEQCRSKQAAVDCIDAALNSCKETNFKALFKVDLQTAKSDLLAECNTDLSAVFGRREVSGRR